MARIKPGQAFLCFLALLSACLPLAETQTQADDLPQTSLPAWLQVYFTDPQAADSEAVRAVVEAVDLAQMSVDVASFDLNLPEVVEALARASRRGVRVRVVYDGENGSQTLKASDSPSGKTYTALKILKAAKAAVVDGGRSYGLMHDKLIIIDGELLFVGSWNLSFNDTFRNNNNLLEITDPDLIANYQAKFDEMFVELRFGAQSQVGALNPRLSLDGTRVENYFSPPDQVMAKLVSYVRNAQRSVRFMIFTFTEDNLVNEMITRSKDGIAVEGVIENRSASQGALAPLFCAGVPVRTDGNRYTMHHKVLIIDEKTVITGSFNFTRSADEYNDDNVLVIHSPEVAALFLQEYEKVHDQANAPKASEIDCGQTN